MKAKQTKRAQTASVKDNPLSLLLLSSDGIFQSVLFTRADMLRVDAIFDLIEGKQDFLNRSSSSGLWIPILKRRHLRLRMLTFVLLGAIIFVLGTYLARAADIIAETTGLWLLA